MGQVMWYSFSRMRTLDSRLIVAHACSIDFSRPIMASTRARTCSFFCSETRALGGQRFLPLPQRPVLLLDLAHGRR